MNDSPLRMLLAALVTLALLLIVIKMSTGCAQTSSSDQGVRTALDALADTIAPASRLSAEACAAREGVELAEAKAGIQTAQEARTALTVVRQRCDALRLVFERIADAHAEARTLVESGAVAEAHARLDEVRALWRSIATGEVTP